MNGDQTLSFRLTLEADMGAEVARRTGRCRARALVNAALVAFWIVWLTFLAGPHVPALVLLAAPALIASSSFECVRNVRNLVDLQTCWTKWLDCTDHMDAFVAQLERSLISADAARARFS
jgi:hypothetical protein